MGDMDAGGGVSRCLHGVTAESSTELIKSRLAGDVLASPVARKLRPGQTIRWQLWLSCQVRGFANNPAGGLRCHGAHVQEQIAQGKTLGQDYLLNAPRSFTKHLVLQFSLGFCRFYCAGECLANNPAQELFSVRFVHAVVSHPIGGGLNERSWKHPWAARGGQEQPRATRSRQEQAGAARGSQE